MRVRIKFAKTGSLRFIGHLDLHKIWERSSRRAGLNLSYSQGFHPQPKIQLASALPLGFSSSCELVDLWIEGNVDYSTFPSLFSHAVPPGLEILSVVEVADKNPPLQTQVVSAIYRVTFLDKLDTGWLAQKITVLLQEVSIPREKRGKAYDLRPLIESVEILGAGKLNPEGLSMQLAAREGATGRPEEVLDAIGIPYEEVLVERIELLFRNNA
jgi:radical SAM-linked protein